MKTFNHKHLILALLLVGSPALLTGCGGKVGAEPGSHAEGEAHSEGEAAHGGEELTSDEFERGPHNGRLLRDGDFSLEITLFEDGPAPLFRLYAFNKDKPVSPKGVAVEIVLSRLGGKTDRFTFLPDSDYLSSPGIVFEPHSFDVAVKATETGKTHTWKYQSYEGRTIIAADAAKAGGISTEIAGAADLRETIPLTGRVEITPEGLSEVRAWYPGTVMSVNAKLGQAVTKGQVIARVESSYSLQTYSIPAPISGVILKKMVNVGEATGSEAMFTIGNPTRLHAEFFLYPRDAERARIGQAIEIRSLAGDHTASAVLRSILPPEEGIGQTLVARADLPANGTVWRPGLGVEGALEVGGSRAPLAVRTKALQPFRDFTVVFAKVGDTYEVRMLELGRKTPEWTEVLSGLDPGTEYVVDGAFLIRADIEKSGASHDH